MTGTKMLLHQGLQKTLLGAFITLTTIATCIALVASASGHTHQSHLPLQHSPHHSQQSSSSLSHPQHAQQPPSTSLNQHAQGGEINPLHQVAPQPQQLPSQATSGGKGLGGFASNAATLGTGALLGAAVASHQSSNSNSRPTRHVVSPTPKRFIDLSHPLHNGTLHWPTMGDVQYSTLVDGERTNKQGTSYYVKADALNVNIHSGTHLDAPRHFSKSGWSVEQIPLERLIDIPVSVIDVSQKVSANRSYNFVKADFLDPQTNASLVQPKTVVLVYTGISQSYDQGKEAYMGTKSSNISEMKIPGFSLEAANYLIERGVYGVGLDSPSADSSERHGKEGMETFDPVAHVALNSANIYILENISNKLADLLKVCAPGDYSGARLTIAPLPIVGGSGSQVRLVAMVGHDYCDCDHFPQSNSALPNHGRQQYSSATMFMITLFLCLVVVLI